MSTKKKTTSTSTTSAASWAQPAIDDSLKGLQSAAGVSQGNAATVQPYLMSAIQQLGQTPGYMQAAQNQTQNTINGGSKNPYASQIAQAGQTSNPYTPQIAAGQGTNPYAQQLTSQGTNDYIKQIANSGGKNPYLDQLTAENPYIKQLIDVNSSTNPYAAGVADRLGQQTGAQYAASFGTAGRTGSGLAALLSTQGIGDTLNGFYSNQYATDQGYRNQALTTGANLKAQGIAQAAQYAGQDLDRSQQGLLSAGQLQDSQLGRNLQGLQSAGQLSSQDMDRNQAGLTSAAGLRSDDFTRQLQALQASGNLYGNDLDRQQSAIGQASNLYNSGLSGLSQLGSLSSLSALLPLQGASAYSGALAGLVNPYATTSGTGTTSSGGLGSLLSGLAGAGLAGWSSGGFKGA